MWHFYWMSRCLAQAQQTMHDSIVNCFFARFCVPVAKPITQARFDLGEKCSEPRLPARCCVLRIGTWFSHWGRTPMYRPIRDGCVDEAQTAPHARGREDESGRCSPRHGAMDPPHCYSMDAGLTRPLSACTTRPMRSDPRSAERDFRPCFLQTLASRRCPRVSHSLT
jgi:hypothetical protein